MLGSLGWQELLIVLVIIALLFGASRVSDLGGALGRGIREFREASAGKDEPPAPEAPAVAAPVKETVDALLALGSLRERGLLTEEEFQAKKEQLAKQL